MSYRHTICQTMIKLKSDDKTEQSWVYIIIQLSYRHTICWTMTELKSYNETEQSSVYLIIQLSHRHTICWTWIKVNWWIWTEFSKHPATIFELTQITGQATDFEF